MKKIFYQLVAFLYCSVPSFAADSTPQAYLTTLLTGNARFVDNSMLHADQTFARRTALAKGQKPFAVIVSCSDSRVPPEIIFDQGLGDLFVIRLAGNLIDPLAMGSIEYAIEHLGVSLVMVLGHERCGAVTAAVSGGHATGHISALIKAIEPVITEHAKTHATPDVEECINENILHVVGQIKSAPPVLKQFVSEGKVLVVGGKYDLDTGLVTILK